MSLERPTSLEESTTNLKNYFDNLPMVGEDNFLTVVNQFDEAIASREVIDFLEKDEKAAKEVQALNTKIIDVYCSTLTQMFNKVFMDMSLDDLTLENADEKTLGPSKISTKLSQFLPMTILSIVDKNQKNFMVERLLQVASKLTKQKNFIAAHAIFVALSNADINRLYEDKKTGTWTGLSKKSLACYEELKYLYNFDTDSKENLSAVQGTSEIYLMSKPHDGKYRESSKRNLFLYKDNGKIFYFIKGNEKQQDLVPQYLEFEALKGIKDAEFRNSSQDKLINYANEKIIEDILTITSDRGHTFANTLTNGYKIQLPAVHIYPKDITYALELNSSQSADKKNISLRKESKFLNEFEYFVLLEIKDNKLKDNNKTKDKKNIQKSKEDYDKTYDEFLEKLNTDLTTQLKRKDASERALKNTDSNNTATVEALTDSINESDELINGFRIKIKFLENLKNKDTENNPEIHNLIMDQLRDVYINQLEKFSQHWYKNVQEKQSLFNILKTSVDQAELQEGGKVKGPSEGLKKKQGEAFLALKKYVKDEVDALDTLFKERSEGALKKIHRDFPKRPIPVDQKIVSQGLAENITQYRVVDEKENNKLFNALSLHSLPRGSEIKESRLLRKLPTITYPIDNLDIKNRAARAFARISRVVPSIMRGAPLIKSEKKNFTAQYKLQESLNEIISYRDKLFNKKPDSKKLKALDEIIRSLGDNNVIEDDKQKEDQKNNYKKILDKMEYLDNIIKAKEITVGPDVISLKSKKIKTSGKKKDSRIIKLIKTHSDYLAGAALEGYKSSYKHRSDVEDDLQLESKVIAKDKVEVNKPVKTDSDRSGPVVGSNISESRDTYVPVAANKVTNVAEDVKERFVRDDIADLMDSVEKIPEVKATQVPYGAKNSGSPEVKIEPENGAAQFKPQNEREQHQQEIQEQIAELKKSIESNRGPLEKFIKDGEYKDHHPLAHTIKWLYLIYDDLLTAESIEELEILRSQIKKLDAAFYQELLTQDIDIKTNPMIEETLNDLAYLITNSALLKSQFINDENIENTNDAMIKATTIENINDETNNVSIDKNIIKPEKQSLESADDREKLEEINKTEKRKKDDIRTRASKPLPIPKLDALQQSIKNQIDNPNNYLSILLQTLIQQCNALRNAKTLEMMENTHSQFEKNKISILDYLGSDIAEENDKAKYERVKNYLDSFENILHSKQKEFSLSLGHHLPALKVDIRVLYNQNNMIDYSYDTTHIVRKFNEIYDAMLTAHSLTDITNQKAKLDQVTVMITKLNARGDQIAPELKKVIEKQLSPQVTKLYAIIDDAQVYHEQHEAHHKPMLFHPVTENGSLANTEKKNMLDRVKTLANYGGQAAGAAGNKLKKLGTTLKDRFNKNKPGPGNHQ